MSSASYEVKIYDKYHNPIEFFLLDMNFKLLCSCARMLVGYLPNGIHAVEAMLAAASIGAIWSSTSVDFGVNVSKYFVLTNLCFNQRKV